jgi:hypothetical protein
VKSHQDHQSFIEQFHTVLKSCFEWAHLSRVNQLKEVTVCYQLDLENWFTLQIKSNNQDQESTNYEN